MSQHRHKHHKKSKTNQKKVLGLFNHNLKHDTAIFALLLLVTTILVGTVIFKFSEGRTWFNSFYFVMITMATIGYGDFAPITIIGKLFAITYAFTGVPLFIYAASFIVDRRLKSIMKTYVDKSEKHIKKISKKTEEKVEQAIEKVEEKIELEIDQAQVTKKKRRLLGGIFGG